MSTQPTCDRCEKPAISAARDMFETGDDGAGNQTWKASEEVKFGCEDHLVYSDSFSETGAWLGPMGPTPGPNGPDGPVGKFYKHVYKTCTKKDDCPGCRGEGMDCRYDVLSLCEICGGLEGALLPSCPRRQLTMEEHDENYKQFCAGTGPFKGRK